jgi:hypothetical protein
MRWNRCSRTVEPDLSKRESACAVRRRRYQRGSRSRFRVSLVEGREDTNRQVRRTASIDELEQRVQVEREVRSEPVGGGSVEPGATQAAPAPVDMALGSRLWVSQSGLHVSFATTPALLLPLGVRT